MNFEIEPSYGKPLSSELLYQFLRSIPKIAKNGEQDYNEVLCLFPLLHSHFDAAPAMKRIVMDGWRWEIKDK